MGHPQQAQATRVSKTCFAIIGAGGLGGPLAYSLAAAGAGSLLVCDDDVVSLSNLPRQVQFRTADVGRRKVDALADELVRRGYPGSQLHLVGQRFGPDIASRVTECADILIDASDNFTTKFAVNDHALAAGMPCVIAGVLRYGGQLLAVRPGATGCYRCLFPAPPAGHERRSCFDAGVLGPAVAVIGALAARAALALAAGDAQPHDDRPVAGELYLYDDLRESMTPHRVRFSPRAECPACSARGGQPC